MVFQLKVSGYSITIYPFDATYLTYTRIVSLIGADIVGGASELAFLNFVPGGGSVPASSVRAGTSNPVVLDAYFPMEDYSAIVDVVRNEEFVVFNFDDSNGVMSLASGEKGPGEP